MKLTIHEWKQLFQHIAQRIEEQKDELSELDRAVGDGDHGVTMSIGWQAIVEKMAGYTQEDCGAMCKEIGMAFLNAVGSSVGPLYATAFIRGSVALQGKNELADEDIVQFWLAAVQGIQDRGKAKVGDKTMMDAWLPAMEKLKEARKEGLDLIASLDAAVAAGEEGMKSTADLISQLGRSSRLGERSSGHIDPGAKSACLILSAFTERLKTFQ
ncbi:dihydroxyacetone kinase subunit DhaL [Paenibacillus thalictri]|uniref:phosphoenolpyruvate--glycerone phosphotransferase n=1 Tax=Paenibacillus thalictri TaxID=2527873 RepID=A0A4Q9DMB4_9BACL|nr:dihydroxyacetone kinase subunit DhaL [Paenibacillus thalictri]TBL74630.1 dihydroxyacetone kinase subunit L [Paenibacillus thalictri]